MHADTFFVERAALPEERLIRHDVFLQERASTHHLLNNFGERETTCEALLSLLFLLPSTTRNLPLTHYAMQTEN